MSKQEAIKEAKYARELIKQLLAETNASEREAITNELVASVLTISEQMEGN